MTDKITADLIAALDGVTNLYCALANSGDAGFWDPEKESEIIDARAALAAARTAQPEPPPTYWRPFWRYEGQDITTSRECQPTYWRPLPVIPPSPKGDE